MTRLRSIAPFVCGVIGGADLVRYLLESGHVVLALLLGAVVVISAYTWIEEMRE